MEKKKKKKKDAAWYSQIFYPIPPDARKDNQTRGYIQQSY